MPKALVVAGCVFALCCTVMVATRQGPLRPDIQLTYVNMDGRRTAVGRLPPSTFAPRISPDGARVAFDTQADGAIWIANISDVQTKRRITTEGRNRGPLWSGDGTRILYVTDHEGAETLFWRSADGTGDAELLAKPARAPESWSDRQQRFSFITFKSPADYDVWTYSLIDRRATPFAAVPESPQHSSRFSPDGRWLAYVSGESGSLQVYVEPFPGPGARVQVTKAGGGHPLWAPDQKALFFDNGGQMFTVAVNTAAVFSAGTPVALPITGFIQGPLRRQYDMTPDGRRFLMMFRPE
jgi:eukaryotic-like serine/threonine-protein kinase